MLKYIFRLSLIFSASALLFSCETENSTGNKMETPQNEKVMEHTHDIHLSQRQFEGLGMRLDTLAKRQISGFVKVNGQLRVPPQNEAAVTAIIGANITSIKVIEGDRVHKGDVLGYLSHPNLVRLQTDYTSSWKELQYLQSEYERQQKLYEEKVGAGKTFQQTRAQYLSMKGTVKGFEAQLKQLKLDISQIKEGVLFDRVPIISPIHGYIRHVDVKIGQFVEPQTEMFGIVNIDHIHADFLVFEKDLHRVEKGQRIQFTVDALPGMELQARIYSVGKSFEEKPKAVHLHAEIENTDGRLIPGMYIRGQILTKEQSSQVIPEDGLIRDGDRYFIYRGEQGTSESATEWAFQPIEVQPGIREGKWVEIQLLDSLDRGAKVAWNKAYYIFAEGNKGEHDH
jgi:cobalt-zinc-cadmium efflux system membrane fusion protein